MTLLTAFLIRLLLAIIALTVLGVAQFIYLRFFDKVLGIRFREAFDKIEEHPVAMSHYFGLRNLGASLAVGLVLCAAFLL